MNSSLFRKMVMQFLAAGGMREVHNGFPLDRLKFNFLPVQLNEDGEAKSLDENCMACAKVFQLKFSRPFK